MTKIKSLNYPKLKTSLYPCCFGSLHYKTPTNSSITPSQHNRKEESPSRSWFPWQRIRHRIKNLMSKTVLFEGARETEKRELTFKGSTITNKVHSSGWKSKSNLCNKVLLRVTPNQSPSKSQIRFQLSRVKNLFFLFQQNRENNKVDGDLRQRRGSSLTRATSTMSHISKHPQTTLKHCKHKQLQNAKRYALVVVTSIVIITLVSMILWGRFCAILCTFAWFYLIPSLRITLEKDQQTHLKDLNNLVSDVTRRKWRLLYKNHIQNNN
ncbi:hypothetical protein VNO77_35914 [Canavalia gladiata]|uniref:Transmembrane protein n=1 Tax=Canavalia gladiata TaxID=3824 RepID=A0AAN9PXE2_CANGL